MEYRINKAVVIGAGVMGVGIAAHLANCGIKVLLLDRLPAELSNREKRLGLSENAPAWRNKISQIGLNKLRQSKRPIFSSPESYARVKVGNTVDDLPDIGDYDWIIETIIEDLDLKKALFTQIERYRKKGTIVSTNTSGLPISKISSQFSEELKQHFLGTHFFNPPTYAKLMEIIPEKNTLPEIVQFMATFIKDRLGKSPLVVKDTPNFIANRLGIVTSINAFHLCLQKNMRVEEADALCGLAMGRMRSAIFGIADAVGLDTVYNVTRNIYENAPHDERRDIFIVPGYVKQMLQNNWLGDKTRMGFYKTERGPDGQDKQMVLDLNTVRYREKIEPDFPCLQAVARADKPAEKVKALIWGNDPGALFAWEVLASDLIYSANRVGEIADTILDIDRAMKWGYYWRLGPFECWDAIGLGPSIIRMQDEGQVVPDKVQKMIEHGYDSFYIEKDGIRHYYDFEAETYLPVIQGRSHNAQNSK